MVVFGADPNESRNGDIALGIAGDVASAADNQIALDEMLEVRKQFKEDPRKSSLTKKRAMLAFIFSKTNIPTLCITSGVSFLMMPLLPPSHT